MKKHYIVHKNTPYTLHKWNCSPVPYNCLCSQDDGSESFSSLRSNIHALHIANHSHHWAYDIYIIHWMQML